MRMLTVKLTLLVILMIVTEGVPGKSKQVQKSLQYLLTESVSAAVEDVGEIFQTQFGAVLSDIDWSNENASLDALAAVPCNYRCPACWKLEPTGAMEKCETNCEETCSWGYFTRSESGRQKRGLLNFCWGFPGGFKFDFAGLSNVLSLLSGLPLLGGGGLPLLGGSGLPLLGGGGLPSAGGGVKGLPLLGGK